MSIPVSIEDYLSIVIGDAPSGHIVVSHGARGRLNGGLSFPISERRLAARLVEQQSSQFDVYVESSLQAEPCSRGNAAGACSLNLISLDFDVRGPAHKETALPESEEDLNALLSAANAPEPTLVLHTGNGLLAIWQFDQAFLIRSEDERSAIANLAKGFQGRLRKVARESFGWKLDTRSDLPRLIRIPGTYNRKRETPVLVRVWKLGDSRLTLKTARDFAHAGTPMRPAHDWGRLTTPQAVQFDEYCSNEKKANFDVIARHCAFVSSAVERRAKLPEPEWYALASILSRCEEGETIFHNLSAADSRYRRDEAQKKFEHAREAAAPYTCRYIAGELQCAGCRRCTFWGRA